MQMLSAVDRFVYRAQYLVSTFDKSVDRAQHFACRQDGVGGTLAKDVGAQ